MNATSGEVSDRAFARVLGQEIRRAREARGWTRAELVEQMPSGIGDRTLLSYEHGTRQLTVQRLIEVCTALGVAAVELLDQALRKARDLRTFSLLVDLRAVIEDQQARFEPIRVWAKNRLQDSPNATVLLAPGTILELAAATDITHTALATYLFEFTSEEPPTE
jgi:transcriptional regulator with XRE-family HTH domain